MNPEQIARLNQLLAGTPPEFDEDELLAVMTDAAEREADGEPVTSSYPQFAAYLRLHPDVAEEYQALVALARAERAADYQLPAISIALPPVSGAGSAQAPLSLGRRFRLIFAGDPASGLRGGTAPTARGESEQTQELPDLGLQVRILLQNTGELGSLFLGITGKTPEHTRSLAGTLVRLYESPPDDVLIVLSNPPLAREQLDSGGATLFDDLDPGRDYYLAAELPSGEYLLIDIEFTLWA